MNKFKRAMLGGVVLSLCASPFAMAKGGGMGWLKSLDLTTEQRTEIKAIVQQHKPERPTEATRDAMQADMKAFLVQPTFDEEQAEVLFEKRQQQMQTNHLQRLEMKHAIFQVLTPEQQTSALSLMGQGRKGMKGKGKGKENREGDCPRF